MRRSHLLISGVVMLVVVLGAARSGQAAVGNTALLLKQSPANGGTVTPGVGVHNLVSDSVVNLTAIPEQGYRFVYWLGDVSDPESNNTVASLDSPKIIIAVFERDSYEYLPEPSAIRSMPGGGLRTSPGNFSGPVYTGGGSRRSRSGGGGVYIPEELPPEVPEPVSLLLLAAGGLFVRRLGRNRKS